MASVPLENPAHTRPVTAPVDASPSSNGLMEDRDSPSTRKRPRLDSGNRSRESMAVSAHTAESDEDHAKATSSNSPRMSRPVTPESSGSQRPSSTVTLNMKSPITPQGQEAPANNNNAPSSTSNPSQECAIPTETSAPHDKPISISSSPSPTQSIQIEVAEVEDMDQDPSTSNWRPLEEALQEPTLAAGGRIQGGLSLVDSFPSYRTALEPRESIEDVRNMIERGHSHDTAVFFAVKQWFVQCSNNLHRISRATFLEDREFWEEIPSIIESFLRRQADFLPDEGHGPWQCVQSFCVLFGQLALHLARLDTVLLQEYAKSNSDTPPDLLSRSYWTPFGWILQIRSIPFFKSVEKEYGSDAIDLVARINDALSQPPVNAVSHVRDFMDALLPLLSQSPVLSNYVVPPVTVVQNMVESGIERRHYHADEALAASPALTRTVAAAYDLFRSVESTYHSSISKKAPWLTSELSDPLLRLFCNSYKNICQFDPALGVQMASDLAVEVPEGTTIEEYAKLIQYGRKFQVLKKLITEGRMELRVQGVETMQTDLVQTWSDNIKGNPAGVNYPVIRMLVKFLRDNRLVGYLVGVDSHPQLISRSGNIVGFLVVTATYTNEDSDVIWKTVTESHDPRTVSEVLGMLTRTFGMHDTRSPALLYLCTKLLDLPLHRFDGRMLDYCDHLLGNLRERYGERRQHDMHHPQVDAVPLRLCVRLMREVSSITEFSAEQKSQLQRFASKHLNLLNGLEINDTDKLELYRGCVQDISEMNEFAIGSINALVALIPPYDSQDIRRLALEFDLTRLITTELAHTIDSNPYDLSQSANHDIRPRIQLLQLIIDKVPETINPDLGDVLWESLFSSKKVGDQNRSFAWDVLSRCASTCARRNPFLERCINEYLPRILPEELTADILSFAEQAVGYEIRSEAQLGAKESELIVIPGIERIWDIILKAPCPTIGIKAINFAIEIYLDHPFIRRAPRPAAEATHVSLVDRCVEQLTASASKLKGFTDGTTSGEDEPMVIVASDGEVKAEELRFSRSLLFLRQLLHGLRTRPHYTPPRASPPAIPLRANELKGDIIEISYQTFSDSSQSRIRSLRIGDLATGAELGEKLVRLTGFPKFTTITGGQRVDLSANADRTLRDLRLATSGLLIVRKDHSAQELSYGGRRQSLTLVDSEVLKHFDDLYELLSLEERLSKEIYDFLVVFPPQQRVREMVKSANTTETEMFPVDKPYKLLYSITSLIVCVREEWLEENTDQEFITRTIRNVTTFLLRDELSGSLDSSPLKLSCSCNFVECLLEALKVKTASNDSEGLFADPPGLVARLLNFITLRRTTEKLPLPEFTLQKFASNSFAALAEASVHDKRVWEALKQGSQLQDLICDLLLDESNYGIRKDVAEIILHICGSGPSQKQHSKGSPSKERQISGNLETPTGVDIVETLWKSLTVLFPKTIDFPKTSQQFFEVALMVFDTVGRLSPEDLVFKSYLKEWGEILLRHQTREFVGRKPIDYVVLGFSHLLRKCLELAEPKTITPNTSLVDRLFTTYLFPNLSEAADDERLEPSIPVMHPGTRQEIYSVLLLLCENEINCGQMLELLEEVIPQDYTYDTNWNFDRLKTIRSPEGYAGLKNLSNTCYLNSLFTQLFVNLNFRKFMLDLPVSEEHTSQRLLAETKKLFAYMQNTWEKRVDTQATVEAIRTYDNELIDINIQMDVDEFYNLLFDRWESQIRSAEDKKVFRSFYGGQLVQQIKSKECSHISERLEPFSAIQCEIKGKSGLEDSLRAYVEGEMMQGDNKYSCTSCNRHVDAVKRACLKDIPDNLIFHLKRFDFDVISMMRSKINDEFQFPERLDMTPYKVEYLSNPSAAVEPDMFELVGVLVHSGTAESGHYYSYIKERPTSGSQATWVEFNDADVSRFDPSKIPDQCFGGMNDPLHGTGLGQIRFNKVWNAYMLFYQRVSSMEKERTIYTPPSPDTPVNIPLPLDLGNHIAMENELFIRTYCLLDPYHACFVLALLERTRKDAAIQEPSHLRIQKSAVFVALDTLDQLISRSKELPEFQPLLLGLNRITEEDPRAALWVLQWVIKRPLAISHLLLRSPRAIVRTGFGSLLVPALIRVRDQASDESGPADAPNYPREYALMLDGILGILHNLWGTLHIYSRAWNDYFELVLAIARLGSFEVQLVLENGFLAKCLEMVWLDREDLKKLKRQYPNYYRLVEKGRDFSHFKLTELLYVLLRHVDLALPQVPDNEPRTCHDGKYSLSTAEAELILPLGRPGDLVVLKKILEQQSNPPMCKGILTVFLDTKTFDMTENVRRAIEDGLRVEPATLSVPFLEATITFCQHAAYADQVAALIDFTAKGVDSIDGSGGLEHLQFFQALINVKNDKIDKDENWFWAHVVERVGDWAPTLLQYDERPVRQATFDFLQNILFTKELEDGPEEFRQFYRRIGRELAQGCVSKLQRTYIMRNTPTVVDARIVEIINNIITHCLENYFDESESTDFEFIQRATTVLSAVEQLTVDVSEELASGSDFPSDTWEDNSMMASDSDIGLTASP